MAQNCLLDCWYVARCQLCFELALQIWFPYDSDLWAQNLEQQIVDGEPVSNTLLFVVLSFCTPIWEEVCLHDVLIMWLLLVCISMVRLVATLSQQVVAG